MKKKSKKKLAIGMAILTIGIGAFQFDAIRDCIFEDETKEIRLAIG